MMAEKITDEKLRKELIALGEKNIGAVTDSTRPIFLKKLNHLRARQSQSASAQRKKSTGKKLLGFSSDESDQEENVAKLGRRPPRQVNTRNRRQPAAASKPAAQTTGSNSQASVSKLDTDSDRKSSRLTRTRPALRSRSRNNNTASATPSNRSTPSRSQANTSAAINRRSRNVRNNTFDDESNNTAYDTLNNHSKLQDSIGLQTSLADESQDSEVDYNFDIPDSFATSDSDLDLSKVPDFAASSPECTNKSVNTSFPLDDTYASQKSEYDLPEASSFGSFLNWSKSGANKSRRSFAPSPKIRQNDIGSKSRNSYAKKSYPFKAEENSSWKSSVAHHVSMFLVILFALFFVCIGIMYWNMKYVKTAEIQTNTPAQITGLCKGSQQSTKDGCVDIETDSMERTVEIIKDLGSYLDIRASNAECGYIEENKNITIEDVQLELGLRKSERAEFRDKVLQLVEKNKSWQIKLLDSDGSEVSYTEATHLESEFLSLPLWCRLVRSLRKVLSILLLLVVASLCLSVGLAVLRWHWRRQEEETRKVYELVEKIIDILKSQSEACQENSELQPYMAIPHVRDMLIAPKERRKRQALWDKAVKFLSASESRVRVEMKTIQGEDFAVWRWLQTCPNGTKVWQGQAFGEGKEGGSLNTLRYSPSPCLKIRNMFDLDVEYGDDWHVYIQDAILEKCGQDHCVLHIAVDKTSKEGCVYVKCESEAAAGKAYKALHGWWFDGNLVTVKYLRLERYHERFPDAAPITSYLRPSNNKRNSLSQPYHHSVMEAS